MLYDSLKEKLLVLPDETLVYPAHGAGSMCGKNLSQDTVSTIGTQRRFNYALQPMSREEFIRIVTADQAEAPAYFTYDAVLNTKEHPTLDQTLERELKPLELEEILKLEDAQLLDVREPTDYEGAHLVGSINIGLGGKYATWAGTLLSPDRPIVIISDPGSEEEAATRLGRIGFDRVAGYLDGGMQALGDRQDLVARTERITASNLSEQLSESEPPAILDVRTPKEWEAEQIVGSLNIPLNRLQDQIGELPEGRPVVVHCESGYRSAIAASILEMHRQEDVADLVGGLEAWRLAKLETTSLG